MSPRPFLAWLRRSLAVWLVVWLTLLSALAPTLSHALVLARSQAPAMVDVCTSLGQRWVTLGPQQNVAVQLASASDMPADSPGEHESTLVLDHCPLCLLAMERAHLARHALAPLFAAPDDAAEPAFRPGSFFLLYSWLTPPSCGPPARA